MSQSQRSSHSEVFDLELSVQNQQHFKSTPNILNKIKSAEDVQLLRSQIDCLENAYHSLMLKQQAKQKQRKVRSVLGRTDLA